MQLQGWVVIMQVLLPKCIRILYLSFEENHELPFKKIWYQLTF